jgi:hypothetical protein
LLTGTSDPDHYRRRIIEADRPVAAETLPSWPDESFEAAIKRALAFDVGLKQIGIAAAETAIRIALYDAGGNLQSAARKLGVTDRALTVAARHFPAYD